MENMNVEPAFVRKVQAAAHAKTTAGEEILTAGNARPMMREDSQSGNLEGRQKGRALKKTKKHFLEDAGRAVMPIL